MKSLQYNKEMFEVALLDSVFSELANKYSINSIDVKNIFINTLEKIFDCNILCTNDKGFYSFYLLNQNRKMKKISFSERIKKDLTTNLQLNIEEYCTGLKVDRVKKLIKTKELVKFEILKKDETQFVCKTMFGISYLPFSNIPKVDLQYFNIGGVYHATIHSYKKNGEVLLNVKSSEIEISKIRGLLKGINIYKINRYYGVRIKIYVDIVPRQIIRESVKLVYPNEKIFYVLIKKES